MATCSYADVECGIESGIGAGNKASWSLLAVIFFCLSAGDGMALETFRQRICLNSRDWRVSSPANGQQEYELVFIPPPGPPAAGRAVLIFDSINWRAGIELNGVDLGEVYGSFVQHEVGTMGALRPGEKNILRVRIGGPPPNDRKYFTQGYRWANYKYGILGDVSLVYRPAIFVTNTFVRTSMRKQRLDVTIWLRNADSKQKKLLIRQAVFDGVDEVLSLPESSISIAPGATLRIESGRGWQNPTLWGYGEYGSAKLYFLQTTIWRGQTCVDRCITRFGFREFWIDGKRFMLNGREIFLGFGLLGPVCGNHRSYLTRLYQAFRSVNLNGVRYNMENSANSATPFEVADELGFFIKPMMFLGGTGKNYGHTHIMSAAELAQMQDIQARFVRRFWNHPSLLWWVPDNENAVGGPEAWPQLITLGRAIRKMDPTRPVEHGGEISLLLAKANGSYPELEMWCARPLAATLKKFMRQYKYDNSIPVMNDEIYVPPVFVDDGTSIEYYRAYPDIVTHGISTLANRLHDEILAHRFELGAASAGPCIGLGVYFNGVDGHGKVRFAWDAVHENTKVQVKWPSQSGRDRQVKSVMVGSDRCVPNWFDAEQPVVLHGIVADRVRSAYRKIFGGDLPGFKCQRSEVIVTLCDEQGRPLKGQIVLLQPLEEQPVPVAGVMTDAWGTAWFSPEQGGGYVVRWFRNGVWYRKRIEVKVKSFNPDPGYKNIQWFDLGGREISTEIINMLAQPAKLSVPRQYPGPRPNPRIFDKALLANLPLDKGEGGKLRDLVAPAADVAFINPAWRMDAGRKTAWFNGKNAFVRIAAHEKFSTEKSQEFSVSMWIKRDDARAAVLLCKRDGGAMPNYMISVTDKGYLRFGMRLRAVYATTPGMRFVLVPGCWHFIVCTFSSSEARIYVDGRLDIAHWKSGHLHHAPGNPIWVGRPHTRNAPWFKGMIRAIRFYNYAINATEIVDAYRQGLR